MTDSKTSAENEIDSGLFIIAELENPDQIDSIVASIQGPLPASTVIDKVRLTPLSNNSSFPKEWEAENLREKSTTSDNQKLDQVWAAQYNFTISSLPQDGSYKVTALALSKSGISSQPVSSDVAIDRTPPSLKIPQPITLNTSNPSGTVVQFESKALDNLDGEIKPVCQPDSGSVFPIGTNNVTCSAIDKSGNAQRLSFAINVLSNLKGPFVKIDKDSYNFGEIVVLNGTAPQSSNMTVKVFTPENNSFFMADVHSDQNGKVFLPIHLENATTSGNWYIKVKEGGNEKIINFTVKNATGFSQLKDTRNIPIDGQIVLQNLTNNVTSMSFKNTGKSNITSLIVKVKQGSIESTSVSSDEWQAKKLDNSTMLLNSSKPLVPGNSINAKLQLKNAPKIPSIVTFSTTATANDQISPISVLPSVGSGGPLVAGGEGKITFRIHFLGDGIGKVIFSLPSYKECSSELSSECSLTFDPNSIYTREGNVAFFASPGPNSFFTGFGGACGSPMVSGDVVYPDSFSGYFDRDVDCTASFGRGPALNVGVDGRGIGMVLSDVKTVQLCQPGTSDCRIDYVPPLVKCGSAGIGRCSAYLGPADPTHVIHLTAIPASESTFVGWTGNGCTGNLNTFEVILDRNKSCIANFEPTAGTTPPSETTLVHPDLVLMSRIFKDKYNIDLGWPISSDTGTDTLVHYQKFKPMTQSDISSPYQNVIEASSDGCFYVTYTPLRSPYWYDVFWAIEQGPGAIRRWASGPSGPADLRSINDVINSNLNFANWPESFPPYDTDSGENHGPPFPPGRGPAPQGFSICTNLVESLLGSSPPVGSSFPDGGGPYCGYDVSSTWHNAYIGGGPPEWASILPGRDSWSEFEWIPTRGAGVIANSYLSKHDASPTHGEAIAGYDLGRYPGIFDSEGENCRLGDVGWLLCNDLDVDINLNPNYQLTTAEQGSRLIAEIEQWLVPNGYRPEPGDIVQMVGRWVMDCGHNDPYHAEIHPFELVVSSYLQTGNLDTDHPNVGPPPYTHPNVDFSHGSTWNMPLISEQWSSITGGRPATINKIVVTSDWQGEGLSFDLWPPPRPSERSILHLFEEPIGVTLGQDIHISLLPSDNPNHIRVSIPEVPGRLDPGACGTTGPPNGEVCAKVDRRIFDAISLWWEEPS